MLFFVGLIVAFLGFRAWKDRMGFRAQRPEDYDYQYPLFDLRRDLAGRFLCEGVIFGPFGRVVSRFTAEVDASWDGDAGVMRERFRYDSGATQDREWHLFIEPCGSIRAEADDVVGDGVGAVRGPAVNLAYRIRLPADAGGHVLDVVDWMYLLDTGTIVNRSQFRKFGLKVAELVATFRRVD
jgi:hypothetical protein